MGRSNWGATVVLRGFISEKRTDTGKQSGKPWYCLTVAVGDKSFALFVEKVEYEGFAVDEEVEVNCGLEQSRQDRDAWRLRAETFNRLGMAPAGAVPEKARGILGR